ncbi:hypothetical protein TNCT_712861 [Trichonephila clavata]|uniref:Uncharacterized protein n=1 Tax=Trichonephila clavata TaxID=2740835 RepID=A0A8X6L245_TRICU|nr:hypothetical protein TNCT_712861 [Trichonephila clavata]
MVNIVKHHSPNKKHQEQEFGGNKAHLLAAPYPSRTPRGMVSFSRLLYGSRDLHLLTSARVFYRFLRETLLHSAAHIGADLS